MASWPPRDHAMDKCHFPSAAGNIGTSAGSRAQVSEIRHCWMSLCTKAAYEDAVGSMTFMFIGAGGPGEWLMLLARVLDGMSYITKCSCRLSIIRASAGPVVSRTWT